MVSLKKLPPLGHRIIKTAIAVFVCCLIHILRGYRGDVASSAVTAVLCMQPYITDTKTFAYERILGTIIGSLWGFLFLMIMSVLPSTEYTIPIAYAVISCMVALALYSTVLIKKTGIAALVVIVFLSNAVSYPNVDSPLSQSLANLADTILGTIVAIGVNVAHLPRRKHTDKLFFVRTQDLVPDRYQQIPSNIHILLEHLFNDGARICLISRWAPAFIISQMGLLNVTAPIIIMDGAALYDIQENKYLEVIDIPQENAARLTDILRSFGATCNIYTIHDQTMCIFRDGPMTEAEEKELKLMKRSPYRNYMEGTYHELDKIAAIRVIGKTDDIEKLAYQVMSVLPLGMFRVRINEEAHFPEYSGLYFYHSKASVSSMKKMMLHYMRTESGINLHPVDIRPRNKNYQPGHDAPILLHDLKNQFEPVTLMPRKKVIKHK